MGSRIVHPGHFIRVQVLPTGLTVTEAAKVLNVGRPALSNLLNGNAALSPEMAARLERAFGANARDLLDMQAAYDTELAKEKGVAASARAYVPPFMRFLARDIEAWADSNIQARQRLSVLLRTLVHSTGIGLSNSSFPGNDDSERPGWDGYVEAAEATPWIPAGPSGWEFGVNAEPKAKADGDYAKSLKQTSPEDRARMTFVFVTPRIWKGKDLWEKERRTTGDWKDVRVLDASSLEEWLEQSIAGQAWFAHEVGVPTQGVLSLDACWEAWVADTSPALVPGLFADNLSSARETVARKLAERNSPIHITADSKEEALGFLAALFNGNEHGLVMYRDRIAVFTEPGPLSKLASGAANFIPVVASPAVEKEFAPHKRNMRSILIYPKSATQVQPDVALEPVGRSTFETALTEMGCCRDDTSRLARESGRSPTVLRRRLSSSEAIRTPGWAADIRFAHSLVPLMLAGAWNSRNVADQEVISLLAHGTPYDILERGIARLVDLDDPPLWAVSSFRGLVSKIDVLFAVASALTARDLETFFDVAELVLSEDDPTLDVPEDRRWYSSRKREISPALREGICETVVLLALHGKPLFLSRLGIDCEQKARLLVRNLLEPVSARKLEADSYDLPMYAEACPDEFLSLIEADLSSSEPQCFRLLRPASTGIFGSCPRTGLLWALENTAWAPETLLRTVDILAKLASVPINDNWANKPAASLESIFRCWMPQTAADLSGRKAALDYLVKHHPAVAWPICVAQFEPGHKIGHYSHKPRWRPDARGYGELASPEESHSFALAALNHALSWETHTSKTLADLTSNLQALSDPDQAKVWNLIHEWAKSATDEDKAWLREKLRIHTMTRRVLDNVRPSTKAKARKVYEQLKPQDVILEHAWLFKSHWVDESVDELAEDDFDYQERQERITAAREQALRAVMLERGLDGAVALAEGGDAAGVVGWLLHRLAASPEEVAQMVRHLITSTPSASLARHLMVSGLLRGCPSDMLSSVLKAAAKDLSPSLAVAILELSPFTMCTWDVVTSLGKDVDDLYWRTVRPSWDARDEELCWAVERMLEAGRPIAAFSCAALRLEHLPPTLLFHLMSALPKSREADVSPLEPYRIAEALDILTQSGAVGVEELAGLEFQYLDALDRRQGKIPNLERQLERHPELFVQAVALAFKRSDDREDPDSLRAPTDDVRRNRAILCYRLLRMMARIPGYDEKEQLNAQALVNWINAVRKGCSDLARADVGDIHIGELLAKAPVGVDGVWPIEPVRDAIEAVYSDPLARGIHTGLFNSRGVFSRAMDEGGRQERDLAARYADWARALDFTHPRVAKILNTLADTYECDAQWQDAEDEVDRRLMR